LKALQGLIWEQGFHSGTLQASVFPDVPPALTAWTAGGRQVRIYSSGSIQAQKLFFSHTNAGDLSIHLSGYYDTTTGHKREAASYTAIAADVSLSPAEILFLSDVPEELDAARAAGMATGLTLRPGNRPVPYSTHPTLSSFDEIELR
jgi:enolase-phosphatase E1